MTADLDRLQVILDNATVERGPLSKDCSGCGDPVELRRGEAYVERLKTWDGPVFAIMHFDCYIEALSGGTL